MRLLYLLALLYASVGACGTMNATAPKTTVVTLSGHAEYSGYPQVIYWITDSDPTSYPTSNSSALQELSFSAEIIETNYYSKTLSPQPGVFAMGVSGMNVGGTDISGSITVENKSTNAHTLHLTIYACTSTSATKCFKLFSQQFSVAAAETCSGSINNATLPTTVANTTTTYEMPFSLTGLSSSRITITSNDMDSNGRLHLGGGDDVLISTTPGLTSGKTWQLSSEQSTLPLSISVGDSPGGKYESSLTATLTCE